MNLKNVVRACVVGCAAATAGIVATTVARRWYRTWGASTTEVAEVLPGDDVVSEPKFAQTHAITIDAAPEDVWPWIAQLGTGRGGWYSYEWIENTMGLGVRSADRVLPELQALRAGDAIPLSDDLSLPVKWVEANRLLLLAANDPKTGDCSWLFLLRPLGDGTTRLIVRYRVRWAAGGIAGAALSLVDPGFFVMERRMLLGIRDRAERLARERVPAPLAATT